MFEPGALYHMSATVEAKLRSSGHTRFRYWLGILHNNISIDINNVAIAVCVCVPMSA